MSCIPGHDSLVGRRPHVIPCLTVPSSHVVGGQKASAPSIYTTNVDTARRWTRHRVETPSF